MRKTVTVELPDEESIRKISLKDKLIEYLSKNPDKTPEQIYKYFTDYNPRTIRLKIASLQSEGIIKKITCKCERSHYFRVN